jgi:hypothetical protein
MIPNNALNKISGKNPQRNSPTRKARQETLTRNQETLQKEIPKETRTKLTTTPGRN